MSQAIEAAIEVNDVTSAANEIERRMTEAETVTTEVTEETTEETVAEDATQEESSEESPEDESSEDSNESKEPETEEPEEEQPETYQSVSELAEAIDMPLEDFLATIKVNTKINGEEQEVSLSDLKNGYQMESDYRRKTTELAEQRKGFEQEIEQANLNIQNKLQEVDLMATNLESQMVEEFNSINWNQLEVEEKEEWLFQRQKFGEKQQQISQMKAQTQSNLQEYTQAQELKNQEAFNATLQKESDLLMTAIPEWNDSAVMDADLTGMKSLLSEYGFSEAESNQIYDHRIMRLVKDSFKRQGMTQKVDVAKKKVKTLPKIVKSGSKVTKQNIQAQERKEKLNRYKKSGTTDDLARALLDRM